MSVRCVRPGGFYLVASMVLASLAAPRVRGCLRRNKYEIDPERNSQRAGRPAMKPLIPCVFAFLLALTAGVLSGCSTRTATSGLRTGAVAPPPRATLAVVPFENLSSARQAGLVLTDIATTVLHAGDRFDVREVSAVAEDESVRLRRLEVSPWERQIGVNTTAAAAVGAALEVDYVLAGSVGEYGFVDGFGETANVGLTLRLVKVADAEVIWAGTLSRKAATSAFHEESVHRLGHEVLIELLNRLEHDLAGMN